MRKQLLTGAAALMLAASISGCAGLQNLAVGSGQTPKSSSVPSAAVTAGPADNGAVNPPNPSPSKTPAASPVMTPETAADMATVGASPFEYKSKYIETDVSLPAVSGIDAAAQNKINAVFKSIMDAVKKDNTASEADSKQLMSEAQTANPYVISVSYRVPYNKNGILDILISDYRYLGGAHGGDTWTSYMFDLKTGKQLGFADLMQKGSDYKAYINGVIRKEIDKRTASGDLAEIATFSDIGDTPGFYLTPEGLVFYFQQYEYFPYAAGIQQFGIPYDDIESMMNQQYASLKIKTVKLQPNVKNTLSVGDIGQAVLKGNASTGFNWVFNISDSSVLEMSNQTAGSDAPSGVVGAASSYIWDFRALKPGTVTIIFRYDKSWDTSATASPEDTVQFTVTVK